MDFYVDLTPQTAELICARQSSLLTAIRTRRVTAADVGGRIAVKKRGGR
jgi:hypothetical protein